MKGDKQLINYIASAVRYATTETGLKDWSDFVILLNEFNLGGKETIIGIPVYVCSIRCMSGYTFSMAHPWDIDQVRVNALKAVLEYQELYPMEAE